MKNKHPHYECIVAWAEGKTIQVWCTGGHYWYDWSNGDVAPAFWHDNKYRVKPESVRYRTALLVDTAAEHYVISVMEEDCKMEYVEKWPEFVRWLGDWQEVEI